MSKETDRIPVDIGCLDIRHMPATLISTHGYHCEVWRTSGVMVRDGERAPLDLVVKRYRERCSLREMRVFHREYGKLRGALEEIVPSALFTHTCIDGEPSVVAVARTVFPWFNIANPSNEEEAVPLLSKLERAKDQLQRFLGAARRWHRDEQKVIDLYGLDNLVLDRNREIRYLDSFRVFFYEDLLYVVDDPDDTLGAKIEVSLSRLDYLEYLLAQARFAPN